MTRLEHHPGRPHWHCTTCGDRWPCAPARRAMLATAGTDGTRKLRVSMLATQAEAESDFEQLGTLAQHGDLHDRFVAWVPPPGGARPPLPEPLPAGSDGHLLSLRRDRNC